MFLLIFHYIRDFLFDETAAKRWLVGGSAFVFTVLAQVTVGGWDAASHWTVREWLGKCAVAAVAALHGATSPKNGKPSTP